MSVDTKEYSLIYRILRDEIYLDFLCELYTSKHPPWMVSIYLKDGKTEFCCEELRGDGLYESRFVTIYSSMYEGTYKLDDSIVTIMNKFKGTGFVVSRADIRVNFMIVVLVDESK